ncbi:hypothetical protein OY671_003401 [Metschnikowia pulcherrima]|nr:hypothetical protein OY671_003401 [Metschnikowia pulcherrima]
MIVKAIGSRPKYFVALSLLATAAFTMIALSYEDGVFIKPILQTPDFFRRPEHEKIPEKEKEKTPEKEKMPEVNSRYHNVLLPAGFDIPADILRDHLSGTSADEWDTIQLEKSEIKHIPLFHTGSFKTSESTLFSLSSDVDCAEKGQSMEIATDNSKKMSINLRKILEIFRDETKRDADSYNKQLQPILEKFMKEEKLETCWYGLAGSSVWLKDYGVHLFVSRLEVSDPESREHPRISMPLAQIYDERWNEIEDVRLVIPTNRVENSPAFNANGQDFVSYRFPRILPIPFDFESKHEHWGTEDMRVLLVKNKNGHDEPVVVYNAYHVSENTERDENVEPENVASARAMYMSFPFQLQKGKQTRDEDESTRDTWYARTQKLAIEGQSDYRADKTWVPFVSTAGDYSEHVMFVTSVEPLRIIKCDLWTADSQCTREDTHTGGTVSPFRGGTPLISLKRMDEEDVEYFLGFTHANLRGCGCGIEFSRPNLVVVARNGPKWSLTHFSSYIDLGMEIMSWKPEDHICEGFNAMIPKGIEFWDSESDIISLDVSVSDITVERIHVKGVFHALEIARYWELGSEQDFESPVTCALEASRKFCKDYGNMQSAKLEHTGEFGR